MNVGSFVNCMVELGIVVEKIIDEVRIDFALD